MHRRLSTALIVSILLGALDVLAWILVRNSPLNLAQIPAALSGIPPGILLHGAAALTAAITAACFVHTFRISTRLTLAVLFLILAAALPVLGILATGALAMILAVPSNGGLRAEDRCCIGNPRLPGARRESRQPQPELRPLIEVMRCGDAAMLGGMLEGLRGAESPRQVLPLLRRFQQDGQAGLQFAAQGVLSTNAEELEQQIHDLRERAAAAPGDAEPRLAAAECCLRLMEWGGAGDAAATVLLRDARRFTDEAGAIHPESVRALELRCRTDLAERRAGPALAAARQLRALTDDSCQALLLEMEAHFTAGDWSALHAAAAEAGIVPSAWLDSLAFWTSPRPA